MIQLNYEIFCLAVLLDSENGKSELSFTFILSVPVRNFIKPIRRSNNQISIFPSHFFGVSSIDNLGLFVVIAVVNVVILHYFFQDVGVCRFNAFIVLLLGLYDIKAEITVKAQRAFVVYLDV